MGVLADVGRVYVTDSRLGRIFVFAPGGDLEFTFGQAELVTPLYIARNPLDGNLYVSDRRTRTLQIFDIDGAYVGEFDPNLPAEELPTFETGDVQWVPLAVAFGGDGTMYVTDLLFSHRLLIFDPDGTFVRSVGTTGVSERSTTNPELYQFPNSVKAREDEVWVADSNNRRLKIYSADGDFRRLIPTEGLPRGFDFLTLSTEDETPTVYATVVDTLSHDVTIWSEAGEREFVFGEVGFLEAQFSYPNDISVYVDNRMFVADSANGRVQVWGWPEDLAPVPSIPLPPYWLWCLSPLLLLPLLALLRRKRFFATDDFIEVMIETEDVDQMAHGKGRKYWMAMPPTWERFKDVKIGDIEFQYLLHEHEHSESDTRDLMERLEIDYETAAIMQVATRAKVFCTQDADLRRLARALEIDVVDNEEYLERFGKREADDAKES